MAKEFILHDGKTVVNRVLADAPVEHGGLTCVEATGVWDGTIGQDITSEGVVPIELGTLTPEEEFVEALEAINHAVKTEQATPFVYGGNHYYPDERTILAQFSVLPYLPEGFTKIWKTADKPDGINNVKVSLDKNAIAGLALTLLDRQNTAWNVGEARKVALKSEYKITR